MRYDSPDNLTTFAPCWPA